MATLNQKILQWASGQVGKSVGAGECWDLAESALSKSGAGGSSDFGGPTDSDGDYVWGDEVDLKDVLPGDVLQYRDYEMTKTTTTTATFADGSSSDDTVYVAVGHPHHTAIVSKNPGAGALTVLEQNDMGHHERVKSSTIRWKDAPTKETSSRKSMKRPDNGKMEMATVTVTVDVSVTGSITAYRPKTP
jgi:hypothetical protein